MLICSMHQAGQGLLYSCFDLVGNLGSKHADPAHSFVEDELVTRNTLKSIFEAEGMMFSKRQMARKCIRSSLNMTQPGDHGYQSAG